jgi:phosphate transport system substrate-binding protein
MSAADGYPITSYTYLLVYSEQAYGGRTIEQARALQKFLLWAADSGQIRAPGLLYGRLPGAVALDVAEMAKSITYNGYALEGER